MAGHPLPFRFALTAFAIVARALEAIEFIPVFIIIGTDELLGWGVLLVI